MKRSEFLASCAGLALLTIPGITTIRPNVIRDFQANDSVFEDITAILENCSFDKCSFINCHLTWGEAPSSITNSRFWNDDEGPAISMPHGWQGVCSFNYFHGSSHT